MKKKLVPFFVCSVLITGANTQIKAQRLDKAEETIAMGVVLTFGGGLLNIMSVMLHGLAKMENVQYTWSSRVMSCVGTVIMLGGGLLVSLGLLKIFFPLKQKNKKQLKVHE